MTVLWTVGVLGLNFWSRLKHFVKFVGRNVAWEFLFIPTFFHLDWLFKEKERFSHILYYDAVKVSEKKKHLSISVPKAEYFCSFVILVSNYHDCKGKTIKLIPYYMIDIIY